MDTTSHAHTPHHAPSDAIGQVLSALCAVHCVSSPLLVTLAPAAASVLGGAHPLLLGLVTGVALWAFIPGYRCHRSRSVLALAVTGIALLSVAALAFEDNLAVETAISLAGASVMMGAHWLNRRLLREAHAH